MKNALAIGAVVCATYSVLQLLVNGVVLDESVIAAQIITGAVEYPPWHPHNLFYTGAFSLPNYLAAVFYAVWDSVLVLSGIRNALYLFLTAFLPFTLTTLLTRNALWGCISPPPLENDSSSALDTT